MKDYLNKYANKTPMFQEGGPVAAPAGPEGGAPAPQGGGGIEQLAAQYAQTRDPQLAIQIADAVVEMIAQSGGGGAPAGPAPSMRNGGRMDSNTPMFSAGGKIIA
jgi:hypothetical protein